MSSRSFVFARRITVKAFTLHVTSTSFLDRADPEALPGLPIAPGADLDLAPPTDVQTAEKRLRGFVDEKIAGLRP